MSVFGFHVLSDAAFQRMKAGATDVISIATGPVQQAVSALAHTPVGAAVVADIHAVQDENLSGAEKFAKVVGNTVPAIEKLLKDGGIQDELHGVEDIARELVQALFNTVKSRGAVLLADRVIGVLGHIL